MDALRSANPSEPRYSWTLYLAAWLLDSVLIGGAVFGYAQENIIEAFVIPSASMEPTVRVGDRVLADKTAYERLAPHKGDIVIFVSPDDRSQQYIKRITALPGEVVRLADGTAQTVPYGMVYVTGYNRRNSVGSCGFGLLPLRDVVAKVRQVYFSADSDGPELGKRMKRVARCARCLAELWFVVKSRKFRNSFFVPPAVFLAQRLFRWPI